MLTIRKLSTQQWRWFAIIIWFAVSYVDWIGILNNPILQTSIAFILFLLPGANLTLLYYKRIKWSQLITMSFILSSFVALLLGITSIIIGLPSNIFYFIFVLVGAVSIFAVLTGSRNIKIERWDISNQVSIIDIVLIIATIISALVLMIYVQNPFTVDGDYMTYNVFITEFAQSSQMSLLDPFLETGKQIKGRFWLAGWLLDQALIVNFSRLNILQIFPYIGLPIIVMTYLAIYDLIRNFGISRQIALLSLIFTGFTIVSQFGIFQVGYVFVHRLPQDKLVTVWLIAPIFIRVVYDFLTQPQRRYGIMLIIIGLLTVNFHAVKFFYIVIIAGGFTALYVLFQSRKWQHVIIVAVIFGTIAMIPFGLRNIDDRVYESSEILNAGEESEAISRLALTENSVLLGIKPHLREGTAFTILYIATALAILHIRKSAIAYYIIASTMLLISVSNPITAPIISKFVTPFQLWRVPWLMPFGLSLALIAHFAFQYINRFSYRISHMVMIILALVLLVEPITAGIKYSQNILESPEPRESYMPYSQVVDYYNNLVEAGLFIQANTTTETIPVFADNTTSFLLPSVVSNVSALIWRKQSIRGLTHEEQIERAIDQSRFYAEDITLDEFHALLQKYEIQYIVLSAPFIRPVNALMDRSPYITAKHNFGIVDVWTISLNQPDKGEGN